jgi:hypothetical protein
MAPGRGELLDCRPLTSKLCFFWNGGEESSLSRFKHEMNSWVQAALSSANTMGFSAAVKISPDNAALLVAGSLFNLLSLALT